jgi:hypothetical protein
MNAEGNGSDQIWSTLLKLSGETEKNHENISMVSRSPGRDLSRDLPNAKQVLQPLKRSAWCSADGKLKL